MVKIIFLEKKLSPQHLESIQIFKNWFIQKPFIARAAGYGLLGGAIASILMWALTDYARKEIVDLNLLHQPDMFLILAGSLLVLGTLVAVISSYFSINKYLKMSLDQLY